MCGSYIFSQLTSLFQINKCLHYNVKRLVCREYTHTHLESVSNVLLYSLLCFWIDLHGLTMDNAFKVSN